MTSFEEVVKNVENHFNEYEGFKLVTEKIEEAVSKSAKIIILSHLDLDGVSSAVILYRLLKNMGAEVDVKLRPFFTKVEEVSSWCQEKCDLLVLVDKGTMSSHSNLSKLFSMGAAIIDHHAPQGIENYSFDGCVVYNPCIVRDHRISASYLTFEVSCKLGFHDEYQDFYALLGLRGDFAFDPFKPEKADAFIKTFTEYALDSYSYLFCRKPASPTRYDLHGGYYTCLYNLISEFYSVQCYGDKEEEAGESAHENFKLLLGLAEQEINLRVPKDTIRGLMPKTDKIDELLAKYAKYRRELNATLQVFNEEMVKIGDAAGIEFYFVDAGMLRLATVAGSIKIHKIAKEKNKPVSTIIMRRAPSSTKISYRSTSENLSGSKLMIMFAEEVKRKFGVEAEGGGHTTAAECIVQAEIPVKEVKKLAVELLKKIEEFKHPLASSSQAQQS